VSVLHVLYSLRAEGCPRLALDLLEGQDLGSRVEAGGPLPPAEAARLVAEVARALEHCHQRGVVHRDVKPGNVVLERASGRPVLVDFGLLRRERGRLDALVGLGSPDNRVRRRGS